MIIHPIFLKTLQTSKPGLGAMISGIQMAIFFMKRLSYFSKKMSRTILHKLQHGAVIKSAPTLQSRPATYWKQLVRFEKLFHQSSL